METYNLLNGMQITQNLERREYSLKFNYKNDYSELVLSFYAPNKKIVDIIFPAEIKAFQLRDCWYSEWVADVEHVKKGHRLFEVKNSEWLEYIKKANYGNALSFDPVKHYVIIEVAHEEVIDIISSSEPEIVVYDDIDWLWRMYLKLINLRL
ncbi:MAG: hypothetical protein ACRCUP_04940 [Mycoplasmatales bacterium]